MALKTKKWDVVDFLKTPEDIAAYLEAAFEEGDAKFFFKALGNAARARGMSEVSRVTGNSRESLYKALSEAGNPSFETVQRTVEALDLRITFEPKPKRDDNYAEARLSA